MDLFILQIIVISAAFGSFFTILGVILNEAFEFFKSRGGRG